MIETYLKQISKNLKFNKVAEFEPYDGASAQDQEGDPLLVSHKAVHAPILLYPHPHVRDRPSD